jgi:hypothetical protein
MIFSIQGFLEDYLQRRGLSDGDQYAVRVANLYASRRSIGRDNDFLARLHRVRTSLFRNNKELSRDDVERQILAALDRKYKGKTAELRHLFAGKEAQTEQATLRRMPRRSIAAVLHAFQRGTGARNIDMFWESRKAGKLRPRPEKIAQALLTEFVLGALSNGQGKIFREVASGIGFVDLAVMLSTTVHLVELKIQRGQFTGPAQLENYMVNESRKSGWLVVFDVRSPSKKTPIPKVVKAAGGTIRVIVLDINPVPPSRQR